MAAAPIPQAGPTSCPANIRELKIAWGYIPQADLVTENTALEIWSLTKTDTATATVTPVTETDANDIGKGDEFPTQVFPTSMDTAAPITKYTSSEAAAWAFCFATGKATKTGTAPALTYAAVPSDPVVNCLDLPPFTYAEQIRAQPDSVIDRALVGMVLNDFTLTMNSGPGRANCTLQMNSVGTGKVMNPSGLALPAITQEHFLNAASATININGTDYVLARSFISLEFRYNNNVRLASGFYPGSGTQNNFAIRGRMEYANREITCRFVARAQKGSPEFATLLAQTESPFTIGLTGAAPHAMTITAPRTTLSAVVNAESDGIVTVDCQVMFLKPTTGSIITMSATTSQDKILNL